MANEFQLLHTDNIEVCLDQQIVYTPSSTSGKRYYSFTIQVDPIGNFPSQVNTGFTLVPEGMPCPSIGPNEGVLWQAGESFTDYLKKVRERISQEFNLAANVIRNDNRFVIIADEFHIPFGKTLNDISNGTFKLKACTNGNVSVDIVQNPRIVDNPNFVDINEQFDWGYPHIHNCHTTQMIKVYFLEEENKDNFFFYDITSEQLNPILDVTPTTENIQCVEQAGVGPIISKFQEVDYELDYDPNWNLQFVYNDECGSNEVIKSISNLRTQPLQINLGFTSEVENEFSRTLVIEDQNNGKRIAEIDVYCQTVDEDERLKTLLSNFGKELPQDESYIFRDADVWESKPDYELINQKRKELMLEFENIYSYLGSYRGVLNAINFFGYNESLSLKEYWLNVDMQDENYKKFLIQDIVLNERLDFENFNFLPNSKYKKTSKFGLFYDINRVVDGEFTRFGLPETEEAFDFTNEEVLIKLYGLREKLQEQFLPLNAQIINITGEAIYFSSYNQRKWTSNNRVSRIDQSLNPEFHAESTDGYIQDLRPIFEGINTINTTPNLSGKTELYPNNKIKVNLESGVVFNEVTLKAEFGSGKNSFISPPTSLLLYDGILNDPNPPIQNLRIFELIETNSNYKLTLKLKNYSHANTVTNYEYEVIDNQGLVVASGSSTQTKFAISNLPSDRGLTVRVRVNYSGTLSEWTNLKFRTNFEYKDYVQSEFFSPLYPEVIEKDGQGYIIELIEPNSDLLKSQYGYSNKFKGIPSNYILKVNSKEQLIEKKPIFDFPLSRVSDDRIAFYNNINKESVELQNEKGIPVGFPLKLKNTTFEVPIKDLDMSFIQLADLVENETSPIESLTETFGNLRPGINFSKPFKDSNGNFTIVKAFIEFPQPSGAPPFAGGWEDLNVSNQNSSLFQPNTDPAVLRWFVNGSVLYFNLYDRTTTPVTDPAIDENGNQISGDYIVYEFRLRPNEETIFIDTQPDQNSLVEVYSSFPLSNLASIENIGIGSFREMEWIVEKTFPNEPNKSFSFSRRGTIYDLRDYMVILPYEGKYTVTLKLFNGYGGTSYKTKYDYIDVSSKQADFLAFTRFFKPEINTIKNNDYPIRELFSPLNKPLQDPENREVPSSIQTESLNGVNYIFSNTIENRPENFGTGFEINEFFRAPINNLKHVSFEYFDIHGETAAGFEVDNISSGASIQVGGKEPYTIPEKYYINNNGRFKAYNGSSNTFNGFPVYNVKQNDYTTIAKILSDSQADGIKDFEYTARPIAEPKSQEDISTYIHAVARYTGTKGSAFIGLKGPINIRGFNSLGNEPIESLDFEIQNWNVRVDHLESFEFAKALDNSFNLGETRFYDNTISIPTMAPIVLVPDKSKIPGRHNIIWKLFDEELNGELIAQVNNLDYFIYTFERSGQYSVEVRIFDTNYNDDVTFKKKWITVFN